MAGLAKTLYHLNRLVLLLLALSFLSLFLISVPGFEFVIPIAENVTRYLPVLLVPVAITMIFVIILRFITKRSDESIGFNDFIAAIAAIALQVVTIITYGLVSGQDTSFSLALPDLSSINPAIGDAVERATGVVNEATAQAQEMIGDSADKISETAAKFGWLGVSVLQFLAFIAYWIANPDPKENADR